MYIRALHAARSAETGGNNAAFGPESDLEGAEAEPKEASGGQGAAGEGTTGEAAEGDATGGKGAIGKDATDEAEPKEDADEPGGNAAMTTEPAKGGVPL